MSYKFAEDLTLEQRNTLVGHRLRLNGANGVNFVMVDSPSSGGIWMSELDITFNLPEDKEDWKVNRDCMSSFIRNLRAVPYENNADYESTVDKINMALDNIAKYIADNPGFNPLDNVGWVFGARVSSKDEHMLQRLEPDSFGYLQITPILRSGEPDIHYVTAE